MLLVGPEPRLPATPSSPWEGERLYTWSVMVKTQVLRGKVGEGPGALGPDPSAETTPGGRVSQASGPEPPTPPMSPTQMWMNVPQAWPSVPTAASTLMGPLSVYATQATSWVLMAGSATVSGQWAVTPRGVEGPAGQHSSPVPAHHGCQLALAEGQRFLVNQGQCWAWELRVGPGRVGGGRETPGGQRVPEPAWPRSSVLPVSQQSGSGWGREGHAGSGCHPSPVPRPWWRVSPQGSRWR